jgi:hypothetical protein
MAEGEHTIIGKIPRERLNQIASRKLSALSIPVRLAADRETLEGELVFSGRVLHPVKRQPIARARFTVVGHDHLQFVDPPLSAMSPVLFYDAERLAAVEQRVNGLLQQLAASAQDLAVRMRALRLEAVVDADRLAARAVVNTPRHAFELLGGAEGVRISRVAPVGGRPFEVPVSFPALKLEKFPALVDLEMYLDQAVPRMLEAVQSSAERGGPEAGPQALEPTPPPRNAVTLGALARAFGEGCILAPNAPAELIQEFQWGGTRYRFVATREVGTTFKGRLIGPSGDTWSDRFDLAGFPGTLEVVAGALGIAVPEIRGPEAGEVAGGSSGDAPEHRLPHPGEVWVMNVVVEDFGPQEVRYVGTDIDGRPYGAARVLKRADFEAVFSDEQGSWRLLVLVDQVQGDQVLYRQLDRQRQAIGSPRRMAAAILVANFVPEAAAH